MSEKPGVYRVGNVLFISKVPHFSTYTPPPPYHPGSDSKRRAIRYLPFLRTSQK
ncbi:hypothetical protein D9M68_345820 [compost metagenome]